MFNNHIKGVVNALLMNLNNAMAERLNDKTQELKTVGKGYKTFTNFRSVIPFFYEGLTYIPTNFPREITAYPTLSDRYAVFLSSFLEM